MGRAGLDGTEMTVGLVGDDRDRDAARQRITMLCTSWDLPQPVNWVEADDGWEQVTLDQVYKDVQEIPGEYAVLYAHTKGAHGDTDGNAAWRRSMTRHVVHGWEECVAHLDTVQAVGCHWISNDHVPENPPFFGGNFWWARASYLRTLPPPDNESRWHAELWVGQGHPVVWDFKPGWPDYPG
jgi:hypothetical protein